jgi:hypothetical protein
MLPCHHRLQVQAVHYHLLTLARLHSDTRLHILHTPNHFLRQPTRTRVLMDQRRMANTSTFPPHLQRANQRERGGIFLMPRRPRAMKARHRHMGPVILFNIFRQVIVKWTDRIILRRPLPVIHSLCHPIVLPMGPYPMKHHPMIPLTLVPRPILIQARADNLGFPINLSSVVPTTLIRLRTVLNGLCG